MTSRCASLSLFPAASEVSYCLLRLVSIPDSAYLVYPYPLAKAVSLTKTFLHLMPRLKAASAPSFPNTQYIDRPPYSVESFKCLLMISLRSSHEWAQHVLNPFFVSLCVQRNMGRTCQDAGVLQAPSLAGLEVSACLSQHPAMLETSQRWRPCPQFLLNLCYIPCALQVTDCYLHWFFCLFLLACLLVLRQCHFTS